MQTLSPHMQVQRGERSYEDIDSYFGGDIAATASILVVGCQNCNSSFETSSINNNRQSGEVYVYKPDPQRLFWSASQILTATQDVQFLGEHVALHGDVLVATADETIHPKIAQDITAFPTRAVIFQRTSAKPKPKPEAAVSIKNKGSTETVNSDNRFKQQQVLVVPNPTVSIISEIAVYDETIVLSASVYSYPNNPNEIYIYTPNTVRFGGVAPTDKGQGKGKGQEAAVPMRWSLHQTLSTTALVLNFYLSIQENSLVYSSFDATKDQVIVYKRPSLRDQWQHYGISGVDVFEANGGNSDLFATLTPQKKLFFVNLGTTNALFKPIDVNPSSFHCIQIYVGDHFGDGWDTAVLTVEAPAGLGRLKETYAPACDTQNPIMYRYCPLSSQDKGIYKLRVEHAKEAAFAWEIMWKVYDERSKEWFFGTQFTEMNFEWNTHFTDFTPLRMENLYFNASSCPICLASPPLHRATAATKPKPKVESRAASSYLRSLRGKEVTASPTVSPAPTIATATTVDASSSLYVHMSNAATESSPWFDSENSGTYFYISDLEGRHLYSTGTSCVNGLTEASCWADLPDGEYVARVGGALDASINRQWKFCGSLNFQAKQTELYFTVQYGVCSPSLARSYANVCNNVLKVTTLYAEIHLVGDFSLSQSLTYESPRVIKSFIDSVLHKYIGQFSVFAEVSSTFFSGTSSVTVGVRVGLGFLIDSEASALVSMLSRSSSGELLETSSLSLHGQYGIDSMSLQSITYLGETEDLHEVDESSFHLVTNFESIGSSLDNANANEDGEGNGEVRREGASTAAAEIKHFFSGLLRRNWSNKIKSIVAVATIALLYLLGMVIYSWKHQRKQWRSTTDVN